VAHAIVEGEPASSSIAAAVGLAAFAIALPIVRVLADAPEFFLAHGLGRAATAGFFLGLIVVLPVVIGCALALLGRLDPRARTVAMAALGIVACGGLLQPISAWSVPFVLGALVGGIVLALAEARRPMVRSVLASFTVFVLLLAVWSLGPSRVGSYVRSSGEPVVVAARTIDTPVVVLVLDEMSMIPVLGSDLAIDEERFPNLASLARTSHWFRNASSVSPQTSASVPALLSGQRPDLAKIPVAADHPTNVFVQLGGSMDVVSYEPITALCPTSVCDRTDRNDDGSGGGVASARALLRDTAVVFRHAVSSEAMREALPSIERGWAGFGSAPATDLDGSAAPTGGYGTFPAQVDELRRLTEGRPGGKPDLIVGHLIAPHMPWITLHDGTTYEAGDPAGLTATGGTLAWSDDDARRRTGYQRHLLQLGALDRALGAARAELEAAGTWDDAIVVVTADHGVQFEAGGARAVGPGGVEVTNVPLFIKRPHQTEGVVEESAALTIDLLPTVLGLLGLPSEGDLDGVDLFGGAVPEVRPDAFLVGEGDAITPDQGSGAVAPAVERRAGWIDPDGGWDAAYQPGIARPLIGRPIAALAAPDLGATQSVGTWSRSAPGAGPLIAFELRSSVDASAVVATCDGSIAAAVPASGRTTEGVLVVSPDHCDAPDAAELWMLDGAGRAHPIHPTT
jgi:hypothetical protein